MTGALEEQTECFAHIRLVISDQNAGHWRTLPHLSFPG
jgi:hypothetical protein